MLDADLKGDNESYDTMWGPAHGDRLLNNLVAARLLFSSSEFFHLNLCAVSTKSAVEFVNQLVHKDRLPKENPHVGLLLLRDAWVDYDVAMLLALRYKRVCKTTFLLQLLLGWLAISCATISLYLRNRSLELFADSADSADAFDSAETSHALDQAVFGIAVALGFTLALDSLLNAKARWLQLRSSAGSLHSIIWNYRARVGPFEIENTISSMRQKPTRESDGSYRHYTSLDTWLHGYAFIEIE